jgi:glutamate/tyrosine decarboxylase-like PLP-dependent enzyme
MSERLRPVLRGIERADSITCDAHKWFSVPAGAGMIFCRHREPVERAFGTDAAYVPPRAEDRVYPFVTSMQWSRRFIGLKLFMTLAEHGLPGLAARIEHQAALGDRLRARLRGAGFEVLNSTPLPVVCFTHARIDERRLSHAEVAERLAEKQAAWISRTRLRGRTPALRACITNYETTPEDVDRLVSALQVEVGG